MACLVVDDEEPLPDLNLSHHRAWWCSAAHISHPSRISATRYRTDCSCRYGGRCSSGALRRCGGRSVVPRLCSMQHAALTLQHAGRRAPPTHFASDGSTLSTRMTRKQRTAGRKGASPSLRRVVAGAPSIFTSHDALRRRLRWPWK
ncbi:hypothetical protein CKAH01_06673 [Colletotrichum kahawae]|uniref:Uncharacterized protein n=1 Tax=Colletotrichum kahawae TaxID=34407 RepID=A0AAD9Y7E6_COLKA|nr:hypothetical protein CKAH01_06673 [Colletotrichum kahawae]